MNLKFPTRIEIDTEKNHSCGAYCFLDEQGDRITEWMPIKRNDYNQIRKELYKFQKEVAYKINARKQKELF